MLWGGLKLDTRKAYASAIKSYETYCALHQAQPWPAERTILTDWITGKAYGTQAPHMRQIKGTTLQSYVSALRSVHTDLGFSTEVFDDGHAQRFINGAKNIFPTAPTKQRDPITRDVLLKLLSSKACQGENPIDRVNVNAAFTTAFAGFLRVGEFTYKTRHLKDPALLQAEKLTRRCISTSEAGDHFTLLLPRSKTDTDNKGVRIVIATAADDACPFRHMTRLLHEDPQEDTAPLFRLSSGQFTRENVLEILSNRLRKCGLAPKRFKGHSFRKGAAQEAYNNHLDLDQIQTLGRWTSDAVKRYYKTDPYRLFALQKQFQTGKSLPLQHTLPPHKLN